MNRFNNFLWSDSMMRTMKRTIIFSLFLILFSVCPGGVQTSAIGATYYVKTGGDDNLDGRSDLSAWATIAKVKAKARQGDIVYFRSQDTWTSATAPVLTATAGVTYDGASYGAGTRAKIKTTYADAANYSIYGTVIIKASNVTFKGFEVDVNSARISGIDIGSLASNDISNVTIDNCEVHNTGGRPGDWNYGILVSNKLGHIVSNVTIANSEVHDTFHEGIAIYASWTSHGNRNDTVLVRNCTVYNTGTMGAGGVGVLIANDSRNVTVEFCNLYNNHLGIWVRVSPDREGRKGDILNGPQNMLVRYNAIHDNAQHGILIINPRTPHLVMSGSFYGNLIYENGKQGATDASAFSMADSSGGSDYPGSVFNIYNNTFYSTKNPATNSPCTVGFGYFGTIANGIINFKNNIVYSGNYWAIVNKFAGLTHANNLVYRSTKAADTHVFSNGKNYNRAGVLTWESSAKNSNPFFKGGTLPTGFSGTYGRDMVPNTDYFAITSGAALNNGATLGGPYTGCINGAGRANPIIRPGGAYDIGAYQSLP